MFHHTCALTRAHAYIKYSRNIFFLYDFCPEKNIRLYNSLCSVQSISASPVLQITRYPNSAKALMMEKGDPFINKPFVTDPASAKRLVRAKLSSGFKPKTTQSDENGEPFTPT